MRFVGDCPPFGGRGGVRGSGVVPRESPPYSGGSRGTMPSPQTGSEINVCMYIDTQEENVWGYAEKK